MSELAPVEKPTAEAAPEGAASKEEPVEVVAPVVAVEEVVPAAEGETAETEESEAPNGESEGTAGGRRD